MDVDEDVTQAEGKGELVQLKNEKTPGVLSRYNPILFFETLQDDSFVVIERPWVSVVQKLPPPLYRPRYGT